MKLLFNVLSVTVGKMKGGAYGCDRTESVRRNQIVYENLLLVGEQMQLLQLVVPRSAGL